MKRLLESATPLYWAEEVVVAILLRLYEGRLETMAELTGLNSLCRVSHQFGRVVQESVRASIRYIDPRVLDRTSLVLLAYFPGVEELTLAVERNQSDQYHYIPFASLRKLYFREIDNSGVRFPLERLTRLEALSLGHNHISNDALAYMTQLKRLDLRRDFQSRGLILPLFTCLERLVLNAQSAVTDATLACLPSLHTLGLGICPTVSDAGLCSRLTSLDLASNTTITGGVLTQLVHLRTLSLAFNKRVMDRELRQLTGLTSLDVAGSSKITGHALSVLTALTELHFDAAHLKMGHSLRRLTRLETLKQCDYHTCHAIALSNVELMRSLRFLRLPTEETIGVIFMEQHPQLTALTVKFKKCVTKAARTIMTKRGGHIGRIDDYSNALNKIFIL